MDNLWLDQQIAELRRQEQIKEASAYRLTHPASKPAGKSKGRGITIFIQALTTAVRSVKLEAKLETPEMRVNDAF